MNNNQLPLVTYEQARRLKKAGFDWPTEYYYDDRGVAIRSRECYGNSDYVGFYDDFVAAPTVALALQYVREVLDVPCAVEMLFRADTDGVNYQGRYVWAGKGEIRTQAFGRYRDAANKLLDMILNEL